MSGPVDPPVGGKGHVADGITVLEASAGTGKTFRVTTIVVTAVADGLPLSDMLLVTFTIKATSELRDRVWHRLGESARAVADFLDAGVAPDDPLHHDLCAGPDDAVRARLANLRDAVANFDSATIATIHSFCQLVLRTVGFAADVDRDSGFVEDIRPLRDEVVDDLLVQKLHRNPDVRLPRKRAIGIADKVTTNPLAPLLPEDATAGTDDAMRVAFAHAVRSRVEQRKRTRHLLGYDDLLVRVAAALEDDERGVKRRLQDMFSLVVVDEFQDTDTVQWKILLEAFGTGPTRLVLVGDPKQAIYAFRGADVHAYLSATDEAANHDELTDNWRSDAGLLRGLDVLFEGTTMGDDRIAYRPVAAAPRHESPRLVEGRRTTPVRIRMVARTDERQLTKTGFFEKGAAIRHVTADLAADVVRLLTDGSQIDGADGPQPVTPGDVAVLVRRNSDALAVQAALAEAGVPAVVNGAGSVFRTTAADELVTLLEALEQPAAPGRARSLALTALVGWRAADIVDAADEDWDRLHGNLHHWRRVLSDRGVAPLFQHLMATEDVPARILRTTGGERHLTDLRHLVELLHEASDAIGAAPSALVGWLHERRADADSDAGVDDRSRRLDTDADAVQVWTVHRSKGQEFPIVYVPFAWMVTNPQNDPPLVFHDDERGERVIHVNGARGASEDLRARSAAEDTAEELRLAYVAMTRARHQLVVWWVPGWDSHKSALASLLFGRRAIGGLQKVPDDGVARTTVDELASTARDVIRVEESAPPTEVDVLPPAPTSRVLLDRRRFERNIDRVWRRTSYSALTAGAHDAHVAGTTTAAPEHSERGLEDEWMPDDAVATMDGDPDLEARLRAIPSAFGDLGGGTRFGTLVHAVLEDVDFTADDLEGSVRATLLSQYLGGHEDLDIDAVVAGLVAAIRTPLGPVAGGRALADIGRADRLDEMHFELPLVGGDTATGTLTMDAIATVVRDHVRGDDLLAGYGDLLAGPVLATEARGYLSGAIDVVMRVDGRYVTVDHKSNWLGIEGETLSAWHYRADAMRDAMVRSHYPLQALIYGVALHRYLRWRLADYEPERHLGGVLYLFLRGMTGPDAPVVEPMPCGVFSWRPSAALITDLSDVFDRGAP